MNNNEITNKKGKTQLNETIRKYKLSHDGREEEEYQGGN